VASIAQKYKTQPIVVRDMNNLGSDALVVGSEIRVPTAVVNLPAKVMLAAARVDGGGSRSGRRPAVHVVRSGDSLWAIAKRHRMTVNTLARLNGMGPGDTLRAGQKLVLNTRGGSGGGKSVSSGHSRPVSYKVRSGDTLSRIAKVFGVTVSDLVNWNGISKHATLRVGQRLTVNARR
jgi:membrane-bound lytic murein transglycosylase D